MSTVAGPARLIPDHYPGFARAGPFIDALESWIGTIRPLADCSPETLAALLDGLTIGETIRMKHGHLLHDPDCHRAHRRPTFLDRMLNVDQEVFTIRLVVWRPPIHPKALAVYPEISSRVFPNHPHLFRNQPHRVAPELPNPMPDAICPYRPGDGEWSWACRDLVDFLDYTAIFLAKHIVWQRTGGNRRGVWIGPQASHSARDLIRELNPQGECRCGSGRKYDACCLPLDRARAADAIQPRLPELLNTLVTRSKSCAGDDATVSPL